MIYGIASWEKIDRMQPWLLAYGSTVIVQQPKFLTSPATYILGIFLTILGTATLAGFYFSGELILTIATIDPIVILAGASIALGIWLTVQAKAGTTLRKEQGGIHPTDTLLVLDGSQKTVTKQTGTTEEVITSFQDMQFEIQVRRNNKQTQYRIQIVHPKGKERIVVATTQASADKILKTIKEKVGITS